MTYSWSAANSPSVRLKNLTDGLPGDFKLLYPGTGAEIGPAHSLSDLLAMVRDHERANGIGNNLPRMDIEDQICARFPSFCRPETEEELLERTDYTPGDPVPLPPPPTKLTAKNVAKATKFLGRWLAKGREKVAVAEAERRAQVCLQCPLHKPVEQCVSCGGGGRVLRNAIRLVVGDGQFPSAGALGACAACGCSLEAKVQIPLDYLNQVESGLHPNCWIYGRS